MADIINFEPRNKPNADEELIPLYRDYERMLIETAKLHTEILKKEKELLTVEEAANRKLMRQARRITW